MTDLEIDIVYDWVCKQFQAGSFEAVELALAAMRPKSMTTTELLTWLTATLPAKCEMPSRVLLFQRLQETSEEAMWKGLE